MSSYEKPPDAIDCPTCNGLGIVTVKDRVGIFECPACKCWGWIPKPAEPLGGSDV